MQTGTELKLKFSQVDYLPPEDRLKTCRQIWDELETVERAACQDLSFPLTEIRAIKELVPHVRSRIRHLEAGLKRKKKAN